MKKLLGKVEYRDGKVFFEPNVYLTDFKQFWDYCNKFYYPNYAKASVNRIKLENGFKIMVKLLESRRLKPLKVIEFIVLVHEIGGLL